MPTAAAEVVPAAVAVPGSSPAAHPQELIQSFAVARYRVLAKATIRDGIERKGTAKVGAFATGDVVEALEKGANTRGQARVRCARGWISLIAGDSTLLLEELPLLSPSTPGGVVPDDEAERSNHAELSADMTMWLLEHPTGELSDWVSESDWVRRLGAAEGSQWTATKCWPEVFDAARRDMQLLPAAEPEQFDGDATAEPEQQQGDDRLRAEAARDLDDLRELGRKWALSADILDLDDAWDDAEQRLGPQTTPARTSVSPVIIPDDGPATWSAAQVAVGTASAPRTPPSAAVSIVNSPQSATCSSFMGGAFGQVPLVSRRTTGRIEADDEWTSVDVITPVTATENGAGLSFKFWVADQAKVANPLISLQDNQDEMESDDAWELVQTE